MRTRLIPISPLADERFVGPDVGWAATGKSDPTCGCGRSDIGAYGGAVSGC